MKTKELLTVIALTANNLSAYAQSFIVCETNGNKTEYRTQNVEYIGFTEEDNSSDATNMHNGHEYVDLGLPSGTMWATCNVGATSETAEGDYYAWGETETKEVYERSNYKWYEAGDCKKVIKYNLNPSFGNVDNLLTLEPEDDVASVKWGGDWRMPTSSQCRELFSYCRWKYVGKISENGDIVHGWQITGVNNHSIFLVCGGRANSRTNGLYLYYWSSSVNVSSSSYSSNSHQYSDYLYNTNGGFTTVQLMDTMYRENGNSVRPVVVITH